MVENMKMIDGKKFMWDGVVYDAKDKAEEIRAKYNEDKFETRIVEDDGKYMVYTRRLVTEIILDGAPPA